MYSNLFGIKDYRKCHDSPQLHTHLSLRLARKKKKRKTKALHHVFIWWMDTLNPENEKNSTSLFWKNAILNRLPYKARSRIRGKITKGSTLYFDECPYTIWRHSEELLSCNFFSSWLGLRMGVTRMDSNSFEKSNSYLFGAWSLRLWYDF